MEKKILVTYFSASGETKEKGDLLARSLNASVFEIVPLKKYTYEDLNWRDRNSRSTIEMQDEKSRPEILLDDIKIEDFDVIFIGYPIWRGVEPRVIDTFIEKHNLDNKFIIPFATSGGSGVKESVCHLRKNYPNLNIKDGLLLNFGVNDNDIKNVINELIKPIQKINFQSLILYRLKKCGKLPQKTLDYYFVV